MKIAVIGSGGREHALAWRLLEDSGTREVFVLPGNPGMSLDQGITCVPWAGDYSDLYTFINAQGIDLVIVGPEKFLAEGLADYLTEVHIPCFGPSEFCAQFESSKDFSKEFMNEFSIPTAKSITVTEYLQGIKEIESWGFSLPPVVKADGLAAGKGVFVCEDKDEAKLALHNLMNNPDFPVTSSKILLEECLEGVEVSSFALFDGENYQVLGHSSDHKRLNDFDKGPNTGGMGTYCDPNWPSTSLKEKIEDQVFKRFQKGLKAKGLKYVGFLFAGIMISKNDEINVIEFNVRLGDPEGQSLLFTLDGDLSQSLYFAATGKLNEASDLKMNSSAVHVVLASKGYPGLDGQELLLHQGIPKIENGDSFKVFFAGVKLKDETLVNSGGRVLGISVKSDSIKSARETIYQIIPTLAFNGAHWRTDIGLKN
ncbi:phosphoribosylamine--glycine ligase [Halobacteriovorax marinus]|uniref:phosphoribosylamine--glycine ligase n=1 Tax=Halobacteriovorax marinus TaxID=97084 RepID=A0A1Y5F969_9BACT|nr:phosphoribosylamine--glycine ligase [Halobacteriovorax marinus]